MIKSQLNNLKTEALNAINAEATLENIALQAKQLSAIYNAIEVAIEATDDEEAEDILFYLEEKIAELNVQQEIYEGELSSYELESERAHEFELWASRL